MLLDIRRGAAHEIFFNTQSQALAPITLAGTPSVCAYIQGSDTQFTTGLTLTVDRDGVTGAHRIAVDTSDQTKWIPGNTFFLAMAAGTVDGISVVGRKVGSFSIEKAFDGRIQSGTAVAVAAGPPSTITLASGDGGADNSLQGCQVRIFIAATGAGQLRGIVSNTGDVCVLDRAFNPLPTTDGSYPNITYRIYPGSLPATSTEIGSGVGGYAASAPLASDLKKVNGVALQGTGVPGSDPWEPA